MKAIGSVLLTVGFLAGSYVTVAQAESVHWLHYGLCAGLMLAGMIALQLARSADEAQSGERHNRDLDTLEASLGSLVEKVGRMEADDADESQLTIHARIDAELLVDIHSFVEARESMIPRLGMQNYADIMSPFATGERLLNRAWSASADGYVDEVKDCVRGAREEWQRARSLLQQARA